MRVWTAVYYEPSEQEFLIDLLGTYGIDTGSPSDADSMKLIDEGDRYWLDIYFEADRAPEVFDLLSAMGYDFDPDVEPADEEV